MIPLKCSLAAAMLLLLSRPADAQVQRQWTVFEPPGGGFRVELPEKPTVTKSTTNSNYGPVQSVYGSTGQKSDLACTARLADYQPGATGSDPQVYLDRTKQNLAAKAIVKSEERFKIGAASAMRLVLDTGDKYAKDLSVLIGDRGMFVICMFPKGQENSRDVMRVFNSFALTK